MKLFTIITFAILVLTAEAKNRGRVGKDDARRQLKSGKAGNIGHECQSCENQLPGYALFGKNYEDNDFYANVVEAFDDSNFGVNFDGNTPEFGEDYFVPGPFGISTLGETCYDDPSNLFICTLITFLGEAIYRSELLSCLYTQILTIARNEFSAPGCGNPAAILYDDDDGYARKRHLLTDPQKEAVNRVLASGITDPFQQDTMAAMAMIGAESLMDLMDILGLNCGSPENAFIEMICNGGGNRKLLPSTDPLPIGSAIVEFFEFVDGFDSDVAMTVQDNLFFVKCALMGGTDTGICAAVFGLLKTFDAIICRFRDERSCGSATCTKDLAFDVNFQAERLVIDLPFVDEFPVAQLLAPCDYCLANKSGGCSAFCGYYESVSRCPAGDWSYGAYILSDIIENAVPS